MSQLDGFQPLWPRAAANDFHAWPEVREARKLYERQKHCLRELADQAIVSPTGSATRYLSVEIAGLLHNLSGTAAHFGEADFGLHAGQLEQPARAAFSAQMLRPLCTTILAALDATQTG